MIPNNPKMYFFGLIMNSMDDSVLMPNSSFAKRDLLEDLFGSFPLYLECYSTPVEWSSEWTFFKFKAYSCKNLFLALTVGLDSFELKSFESVTNTNFVNIHSTLTIYFKNLYLNPENEIDYIAQYSAGNVSTVNS